MRSVKLLVLACATGLVSSMAAAQQGVITYKHSIVDCDWLAKEYQAILERNKTFEQGVDSSVTRARLVTIPLFIITGDFGGDGSDLLPEPTDIKGKVDFSGMVADIAFAAREKNCYHLFDEIVKAEESGKFSNIVPAPVRSPIGTED